MDIRFVAQVRPVIKAHPQNRMLHDFLNLMLTHVTTVKETPISFRKLLWVLIHRVLIH